MFTLTESNSYSFIIWVLLGLAGGFWLAFGLSRYVQLYEKSQAAKKQHGIAGFFGLWMGLFFPKKSLVPVVSEDKAQLKVRRYLRLGYFGLMAWLLAGVLYF